MKVPVCNANGRQSPPLYSENGNDSMEKLFVNKPVAIGYKLIEKHYCDNINLRKEGYNRYNYILVKIVLNGLELRCGKKWFIRRTILKKILNENLIEELHVLQTLTLRILVAPPINVGFVKKNLCLKTKKKIQLLEIVAF